MAIYLLLFEGFLSIRSLKFLVFLLQLWTISQFLSRYQLIFPVNIAIHRYKSCWELFTNKAQRLHHNLTSCVQGIRYLLLSFLFVQLVWKLYLFYYLNVLSVWAASKQSISDSLNSFSFLLSTTFSVMKLLMFCFHRRNCLIDW